MDQVAKCSMQSQSFHITNIFWFRMADQNHEMADIFVSHFLLGDHHLGDE
jgi:hypothetical protein